VTLLVSSGAAAEPSPLVPTVYNWIVEFETGSCPPRIVPLIPIDFSGVALDTEGDNEQPDRRRMPTDRNAMRSISEEHQK
jgi:hypothetical protein